MSSSRRLHYQNVGQRIGQEDVRNGCIIGLIVVGLVAAAALVLGIIAVARLNNGFFTPMIEVDMLTVNQGKNETLVTNGEAPGSELNGTQRNVYFNCPNTTLYDVSICSLLCPSQNTTADCSLPCPENPLQGGCYVQLPCHTDAFVNKMYVFHGFGNGVHHVEIAPTEPECTSRFYVNGVQYRHAILNTDGTGFQLQATDDTHYWVKTRDNAVCFSTGAFCV